MQPIIKNETYVVGGSPGRNRSRGGLRSKGSPSYGSSTGNRNTRRKEYGVSPKSQNYSYKKTAFVETYGDEPLPADLDDDVRESFEDSRRIIKDIVKRNSLLID